ncbi:MAG: Do family serine endopeptidase [Candidatus Eisenbacteria bacterium]
MDGRSIIHPRNYILGAAVLVTAGLVMGLGLSAGLGIQRDSRATTDVQLAAVSNSASLPESPFVSVVERALPAVVFIDVQKRASASDGQGDDLMRRMFGENAPRRQQSVPSSGSGFIVDKEGRIITNNHVVANSSDINVTLNDGRRFKATLVGADPATDVAVIKIVGSNLPVLPLGDSDRLRVGDWAIAIGNPLGELRGSVTVGIVSAQGRNNLNIFGGTPGFQDFIQTDASINFGNSGGPLCNIRGEAIGINTAINTSGQGIGFAIPINLARHVVEQLVAHGSVKRAMMGVMLATVTPELAEGFGLESTDGVLIEQVVKGSPAEAAGLKRNDVILEFMGQRFNDVQKLRLKVADTPIGKTVTMVVLRDGRRIPINLTLRERDETALAGSTPTPMAEESNTGLGLTVRELRDEERQALSIEAGVRVTAVDEGSVAEEAGIQPNDVIEQVQKSLVQDPTQFARLVAAQKKTGRAVVLLVNRNGSVSYIPLKLDK